MMRICLIVTMALLFSVHSVQAMPTPDYSFPNTLFPGDSATSDALAVNDDFFVRWFEFEIDSTSTVTLDTLQSTDGDGDTYDTILALYDSTGALVFDDEGETQNDDCGVISLGSCQTFSSLLGGTYIVGVTEFFGLFEGSWILDKGYQTVFVIEP